jgi:signal transduction histidine kinase
MDITERKRLEREVFQISDLEQRRIGQDLHDGICQDLAGIELRCEVLERNLERKSSPLAAQAGEIGRHVREVIGQTRSLARGLSPVVVESEGLMSALAELAARTTTTFDVQCHLTSGTPVPMRDPAVATHLYRIAQEAVANAIKHGKARTIEISLAGKADNIVLTIADDGLGFGPGPGAGKGMGLRIMRYRAGNIGATLLIQRRGGGGTAIVCVLPKPDATTDG